MKEAFHIPEKSVLLARKVVDEDVRPTVVVVILEGHSHPGECLAVVIVSQSGRQPGFRKRSVAIVVEQLLCDRIVGNQNIGPPIMIVIVESRP